MEKLFCKPFPLFFLKVYHVVILDLPTPQSEMGHRSCTQMLFSTHVSLGMASMAPCSTHTGPANVWKMDHGTQAYQIVNVCRLKHSLFV